MGRVHLNLFSSKRISAIRAHLRAGDLKPLIPLVCDELRRLASYDLNRELAGCLHDS